MKHALILLGVAACSVTEQRLPVDSSITVHINNPLDIELSAPLRYAVVWTLIVDPLDDDPDPFAAAIYWIGDEGAVDGGRIEIPLTIPPPAVRQATVPLESVAVFEQRSTDCLRPRVLLYEDVNQSGTLEIPVLHGGGSDTVIAIDGSGGSVCYLPNLKTMLKESSLEATEAYYSITRQRYTPFVPALRSTAALTLRVDGAPLQLRMTDSAVPQNDLACLRTLSGSLVAGLYATSRVSGFVNTGLNASSVCGAIFPDCTAADLEALGRPELSEVQTDALIRLPQCRAGDQLESLVVHHSRLECEDCSCFTRTHSDVYFVNPAEPYPSWWPCGAELDYCVSDMPLYAIDTLCLSEE